MKNILFILILIPVFSFSQDPNYGNLIDSLSIAGYNYGNSFPDFPIVVTLNPGDDLKAAIEANDNGSTGVTIYLKNGTYILSSKVVIGSNLVVRGQSRTGVVIECDIRTAKSVQTREVAFRFASAHHSGFENLTYKYVVSGCLPQDETTFSGQYPGDWDFYDLYAENPCNITNLHTGSFWVDSNSEHIFFKDLNIINSGTHPIVIYGDNCTIQNNKIHGAYNKGVGVGGAAYLHIQGSYNLVINNDIDRIRHLIISASMLSPRCKYNVVINNKLECDINFHGDDDSDNLVEGNILTADLWNFRSGGLLESGVDGYHNPPSNRNYIYNNDTSGASNTDYGVQGTIYSTTGVNNVLNGADIGFEATALPEPVGGTFYPKAQNR